MYKDRTGEINKNNCGSKMKIIKYISAKEIIIEFEDGYITKNNYANFKKGLVKNPFDKTIYGVGFIGIDDYNEIKNISYEKPYQIWRDMMYRCYNNKTKAYNDSIVVDAWHNYKNFKEWFNLNYYTIEGESIHLDKDIMIENNKIYSPSTCIFVPQTINQVFQRNRRENKELPIGVMPYGKTKFIASMCDNIDKCRLQSDVFMSPIDAHLEYINMKRNYILKLAEHYKYKIPNILYDRLIIYSKEFIKYVY